MNTDTAHTTFDPTPATEYDPAPESLALADIFADVTLARVTQHRLGRDAALDGGAFALGYMSGVMTGQVNDELEPGEVPVDYRENLNVALDAVEFVVSQLSPTRLAGHDGWFVADDDVDSGASATFDLARPIMLAADGYASAMAMSRADVMSALALHVEAIALDAVAAMVDSGTHITEARRWVISLVFDAAFAGLAAWIDEHGDTARTADVEPGTPGATGGATIH